MRKHPTSKTKGRNQQLSVNYNWVEASVKPIVGEQWSQYGLLVLVSMNLDFET